MCLAAMRGLTATATRWKILTQLAACAPPCGGTRQSTREQFCSTAPPWMERMTFVVIFSHKKRDASLQQFCRKLLGYSLGRSVILSDRPLLAEMQAQLRKNGYRITAAIEEIVA